MASNVFPTSGLGELLAQARRCTDPDVHHRIALAMLKLDAHGADGLVATMLEQLKSDRERAAVGGVLASIAVIRQHLSPYSLRVLATSLEWGGNDEYLDVACEALFRTRFPSLDVRDYELLAHMGELVLSLPISVGVRDDVSLSMPFIRQRIAAHRTRVCGGVLVGGDMILSSSDISSEFAKRTEDILGYSARCDLIHDQIAYAVLFRGEGGKAGYTLRSLSGADVQYEIEYAVESAATVVRRAKASLLRPPPWQS